MGRTLILTLPETRQMAVEQFFGGGLQGFVVSECLFSATLMWWAPHTSFFVSFVCFSAERWCVCVLPKNKKWEGRSEIKETRVCLCVCVCVYVCPPRPCLYLSVLVYLPLCKGGQSYYFSLKKVICGTHAFLVSLHLTRIIEIDVNIPYDISLFS